MPPTSATTRLKRLPAVERSVLAHNHKLCAEWLQWLRDHGRAPITVYQYGAKCDELLEFLGAKSLDAATLDDLERWVSRPRKGRGAGDLGADATRAKDVGVLRGLYKWAVAHGRLAHNPAVDLEQPRVRNEDPKAIEMPVWREFWLSPTLDNTERATFGLGFFCGLRREEMCRLRPENVDVAVGRIVDFPRKGDRNKKRSGNVPVVSLARLFAQEHPKLLPDADAFLAPLRALCVDRKGEPWLLPWGQRAVSMPQAWRNGYRPVPDGMTSPDQINHHLRYALKRAEMPERAITPHALRHSFVTYLLRAGVKLEVVSKLANHSNINITLRYVKVADDPIADMLQIGDDNSLKGSRW